MKNKQVGILKWGILYPMVSVLCLEIALRILGWGTFYINDYSIRAEPKNAFIGHEEMGIQLNPGKYAITLNDSVHFITTHTNGRDRLIPGNELAANASMLLLGCSFTYGYGVNDGDTFAALVQQAFPEEVVRNKGVIGYGTIQSLLQLREMIKQGSLETVLLNFSSFHFMRNGLSQAYRSNLKIGYQRSSPDVASLMQLSKFPYINECSSEVKYQPWESMYTNWYGRNWSAIVNWLQVTDDRRKDAAIDELSIAACLIREMSYLCRMNGITFGVVCLDSTPETIQLQSELSGLNWLNVGFDFSNPALTNIPYDSHPNKMGHELIAHKINPFLTELLNDK